LRGARGDPWHGGRPSAADLHLLPPGAGDGGPGGSDPPLPDRSHHAGDRERLPGAGADDGPASCACQAQDPPGWHQVRGARRRGDRELIAQGVALLDAALAGRSPGPYQLQAAIASLHARARSFEETDWAGIAALYGELGRRAPSPVVEVNRAVAVGMADGPRAGLAVLEPILASGALGDYGPLHAAHAD